MFSILYMFTQFVVMFLSFLRQTEGKDSNSCYIIAVFHSLLKGQQIL